MATHSDPLTLLRAQKRPARQALDERCVHLREAQNWSEALQCCWTVIRQCVRAGDSTGHALALVYLAEIYRAMNQLGQAAYSYQQAIRIFHLVNDAYHEGVAHWGLAQVQEESQKDLNATTSYGLAADLFQQCQNRAHHLGRWDEAERVGELSREIEGHLSRNSGTQPIEVGPAVGRLEWLPILRLDNPANGRMFDQSRLDSFVIASQFVINDVPFHLHPLNGDNHFRMRPGGRYFAIPVPVDGWAGLNITREDYVLVRWVDQPDTTGLGVGWTSEGLMRVGRFVPDQQHGLRFITSGSPGTAIGTDIELSLKVVGYIEAIFKRA